ncbi:S8 family serine peptidase [Microcella alkalica]|uniref:S8 family serine peptidase n=1 Tax=Microcella alkalica TaxID=355930 RepID=UPI00145DDC7D|nr:S8 family serine peptidase [Microcella alkalica]
MRARPARVVAAALLAAAIAAAPLAVPQAALSAPAGILAADAIRDRQYWLDEYGIREAWQVTRGAGVTIAIIDSGVDASHPDLRGAVVGGIDLSGVGAADGTRPVGSDAPDHGTMVASLAAGRGSAPGDGVIGAAPEASLLSASLAFGPEQRDGDAQVAEAVRWAVDAGADVISLSLTRNTLAWPESWDDAFGYAEANDVVVIAAAGNRGSGTEQVGAPATIPGVVAVGGVDRAGRASDAASAQGISIAVMAPSEQLVGAVPGGGHVIWQGTSGAAPIVAGIAALIRAAHPEATAADVVTRLITTAQPVTATVPDPLYGYGLVDAAAAVRAELPAATENPLGSLAEWVALNRRAEAEAREVLVAGGREAIARAGHPADGEAVATAHAIAVVVGPVALLGAAVLAGSLLVIGAIVMAAPRFVRRERAR